MHVKITLLTFFKVAGSVISNRKNSVGVKFAFCSANNEFLFSCDGKELKEEATVSEQKCCSSGSITRNWELLEVTWYAKLHCCCCNPNLKSKMKKTWSFLLSLTVPLHFRLQFLKKKKLFPPEGFYLLIMRLSTITMHSHWRPFGILIWYLYSVTVSSGDLCATPVSPQTLKHWDIRIHSELKKKKKNSKVL